jgi:hypothetical protein
MQDAGCVVHVVHGGAGTWYIIDGGMVPHGAVACTML